MALPVNTVFTLAWRNLWRNYRRTLIMLAAITLGVWAMIFMSAMMRGMTDSVIGNGLALLPGEVQIHHRDYLRDPSVVNRMPAPGPALVKALDSPPITAWSARVKVPAVVSSERDSRGVVLLGIDPLREAGLGSLPDDIIAGRFLDSAEDRGVVLGASLARRLETELGKRVVLMSQDPDNNVADKGVRVVGIYRARLQGTEDVYVYAGLRPTQAMLGIGEEVSEIAATAGDYRAVSQWYPQVAAAAGNTLDTQPWPELDAYLGTSLKVQDGFSLVFMVVVFMVLAFGLVNTLIMAVFERVREIGLMQALGMKPALILAQILLESILLLVLGLAAGNGLAWLTIKPMEAGIELAGVSEGLEMAGMSATLYPTLDLRDMAMATAVVLALGLLASIVPAWRAANLDPITALAKN